MRQLLLLVAVMFALVPVLCSSPVCNGTSFSPILSSAGCSVDNQSLFSALGISNISPATANVSVSDFSAGASGGTSPSSALPFLNSVGSNTNFSINQQVGSSFNFSVTQQVCGAFGGACASNLSNLFVANVPVDNLAGFRPAGQVSVSSNFFAGGAPAGFQQSVPSNFPSFQNPALNTFHAPEPASLLLMGSGLLGLGLVRRRVRKR